MDIKQIITSQYLASLAMLKQVIADCPPAMWDNPDDQNRFWHVAYHALFYTHFYLHPSENEFEPWSKNRRDYQFMGPTPWPPHAKPRLDQPYTRADLLEYVEVCQAQVVKWVAATDLSAAESGFHWLPFGKLELQIYSMRHLQQHIGELCDRLGERAGLEIDWVGIGPAASAG
ncbi:MAG: hypothetical protein FOGNACKC_01081 [Anaerolineae bacterium]|nr:hypothetical protein [Anaerolineae bacterium]